jgi:4-diphosphocytidyl-2-C-methyl-D-erythritol kinase
MKRIIINSPAKINFGLNIINKRPDGYHNIETIFYPINLSDKITIEKSSSFIFNSNNELIKNENSNLIIKAIRKLEEFTKQEFVVNILLDKKIPVGAGMGGGSSNAASILISLNELFKLDLSYPKLSELALELGADVPFFLDPYPKFAQLKGEKLSKINFEIDFPVLIVWPGIHISTKWAYENVNPKNNSISLNDLLKEKIDDYSKMKELIVNDFEEIVFRTFPEIGEIKSELYYLGATFALMTGSGSSLFGIFPNFESAERAAKTFNHKYFTFIHYEKN